MLEYKLLEYNYLLYLYILEIQFFAIVMNNIYMLLNINKTQLLIILKGSE